MSPEPTASASPEPFAYVTGRDGHYLLKRNGIFEAVVKIDCHPDYEPVQQHFRLTAPRIPYVVIEQAASFLRAVYDRHGTEAVALLCYHVDTGWTLSIPRQTVSSFSVAYDNHEHKRVVGSIHSHPGIEATASVTDELDEADFDGVHIVINPLSTLEHGMTVTASVNGRRFPLPLESVVDDLPSRANGVPEAWLSQVNPVGHLAGSQGMDDMPPDFVGRDPFFSVDDGREVLR